MAQKKRTRQSRRRQQVRRQLLIVLVLIVAVVCAAVSCHIQETRHKAEAKAAVKTDQQKSAKGKKEKAKVKVETPKQRLKRVEITAKQKGYPDSVVGLLGKNKETVDFVEDYEAKKDVPAADNIGESYVEGENPAIAAMGRALGLCFLRHQYRGGKRMRANLYGYGSGRS